MLRISSWILILLLLVTVGGVIPSQLALAQTNRETAENLIVNPGFEKARAGKPAGWSLLGDVAWVTDEVHSGERALRVRATGNTAKIKSNWFRVPEHAHVDVSAWMKAENIMDGGSYHKLRLAIYAYAEDRTTQIRSRDLVFTSGSFDWKKVQGSLIVPPGTVYMHVGVQMSNTHGTFWIDDVEVRVAQPVPAVELSAVQQPIVLPQPWRMRMTGAPLRFSQVEIDAIEVDERVHAALTGILDSAGITYSTHSQGAAAAGAIRIIVGDHSHPILNAYFQNHLPYARWVELGNQGYFISVAVEAEQPVIYLGANSEVGHFYGLQTLRQLIDIQEQVVHVVDIVDRPTLNRRGVVVGRQWFDEPATTFAHMRDLKLNFLWVQGNHVDRKFWYHWREAFTHAEKAEIRNYIKLAHSNFIDLYLAIGPRGWDESEPTTYSSEADIELVVDKMKELYNLGLRHFGLAYDDLQHFGQGELQGADRQRFNSIGEAHVYFANEVYRRLLAAHPDIEFMVVPMIYHRLSNRGDTDDQYLRDMGKMAQGIELYTVVEYMEDAEFILKITNRPNMVWDNYWASFYRHPDIAPTFVAPLNRPQSLNNQNIAGYTFMPMIPTSADDANISWKTASDYAWAPERYNASHSFQLAAAQYLATAQASNQDTDLNYVR
jgi:hypothetical protein